MARSQLIFILASSFLFGVFWSGLGQALFLFFTLLFLMFFFVPFGWKIALGITAAATLGFLFFFVWTNLNALSIIAPLDKSTDFQGIVVSEIYESGNVRTFDLKLSPPLRGTAKVVTGKDQMFLYGDLLTGNGRFEKKDGSLVIFFPQIDTRSPGHGNMIKQYLLGLKMYFIGNYRRYLSANSSALLSGLTFGYKNDFSTEFKNDMSRSGTTHLVALSGYNISIIVFAFGVFLSKYLGHRKAFFATIGAIILFVVMTGGEASIIRASIMGFLGLLAKETGRLFSIRNAIILAALIMTLFDPTVIAKNIGFQLSFLSMLGIVYFTPILKAFLDKNIRSDLLNTKENLSATIGAQLMVLPILILNFGQFSVAAIISNMLILGLVPITMFLGFLLGAISAIIPFLAYIVSLFIAPLLGYQISVISFFSRHQIFLLRFDMNIWFLLIYYLILGSISLYFFKRTPKTI